MGFWSDLGDSAVKGLQAAAESAPSGVGSSAIGLGVNFAKGFIGNYFGNLASDHALENNLYMMKMAPSAQLEGLRKAGINPIAVFGNGGSLSTGAMQQPYSAKSQSDEGLMLQAQAVKAQTDVAREEKKVLEFEAKQAEAKAKIESVNSARANVDFEIERLNKAAELEALTGIRLGFVDDALKQDGVLISTDGRHNVYGEGTDPKYEDLVKYYRNHIDKARYLDSREHAIYEDVVKGVGSAADLTRAGSAAKQALRHRASTLERIRERRR